mmetsp:Transcript_88908/g.254178  ORF Transcript_88908/g.254178 Transcript_88908/m.254178 type:complete len:489 (+) Transcript_88908:201-1667(+)
MVFRTIMLVLQLAAYGQYSYHGDALASDYTGLETAAQLFDLAYEVTYITLLVFLAKGWTIVRRKLSVTGRVKIGVFATTYSVVGIAAILWRFTVDDPSSITAGASYVYETPPGVVSLLLRPVAALWFVRAAAITTNKYEAKRHFYQKFVPIGVWWILIKPIAALFALAVPDTDRLRSATILENLVTTFLLLMMASMYNPDLSMSKSFPFHASTAGTFEPRGTRVRGNGALNNRGAHGARPNPNMQGSNAMGVGTQSTAALQDGARARWESGEADAAGQRGGGMASLKREGVVVDDGFRKEHLAKLIAVQQALHNKITEMSGVAEMLGKALGQIEFIDEEEAATLLDAHVLDQDGDRRASVPSSLAVPRGSPPGSSGSPGSPGGSTADASADTTAGTVRTIEMVPREREAGGVTTEAEEDGKLADEGIDGPERGEPEMKDGDMDEGEEKRMSVKSPSRFSGTLSVRARAGVRDRVRVRGRLGDVHLIPS